MRAIVAGASTSQKHTAACSRQASTSQLQRIVIRADPRVFDHHIRMTRQRQDPIQINPGLVDNGPRVGKITSIAPLLATITPSRLGKGNDVPRSSQILVDNPGSKSPRRSSRKKQAKIQIQKYS